MASPPPQMRAVDRLSDLPEPVLTHLLSFLPTKECVATSILSRRWRFLWQYVPVLDLSEEDQNQDTVTTVLLLHKVQRIDAFRLYFKNDNSHIRLIEAWIVAAIERNVRKLDLSFYKRFVLPPRLFSCENLVDLRLRLCSTNLYAAVCLPRLKRLHLVRCRFNEADESLPRLLSGCPVLEELQIRDAEYSDLVRCNISSPTVKMLGLSFSVTSDRGDDYNRDYRLELNTPALEDLRLFNLLSNRMESGPLSSLINANIVFCNLGAKKDALLYYTSALNSVNRLNDVKSLSIFLLCFKQDVCLQDIDSLLAGWTVSFNNLTRLTLVARSRFLPKFLESANNLQFLYFRERQLKEWREMEVDSWIEPQCVPTCLVSHLTTIRLGGLCGVHDQLEMIRYLLKNAQVLVTMEISLLIEANRQQYESDNNKKAQLIEEISLFERGSATCELIFP